MKDKAITDVHTRREVESVGEAARVLKERMAKLDEETPSFDLKQGAAFAANAEECARRALER